MPTENENGPETIKCRPSVIVVRESLQLAVRCQLNQLISGGRHVIKQRPGKVRRFGDLSQPAGSWRATTAVPLLHSDLG